MISNVDDDANGKNPGLCGFQPNVKILLHSKPPIWFIKSQFQLMFRES